MSKFTPAVLPAFFRPRFSASLIRVGQDYDGGYLIDGRDVAASTALLSFGLNDDWSFERDFLRLRPVPLQAYDATLRQGYLFKRLWRSLKRLKPHEIAGSVHSLVDYPRFFAGDRRHFRTHVGLDGTAGYVSFSAVMRTLDQSLNGRSGIFVKIDIEGSEYRILDELIEHGGRFSALAIEFHDIDIHLAALERFVSRFPLKLVHVHANNHALTTGSRTPLVIECSFTASPPDHDPGPVTLPHALDMPNKRNRPEIAITFV
jgi:hypothetical protein